ncbi:MAG: hypothetical protein JSU87_02520 [Gemmatimonadota bacterium]|nr:MAG: hypothetical protein JSU87_02520 [Gemmatimonadota bacterium]
MDKTCAKHSNRIAAVCLFCKLEDLDAEIEEYQLRAEEGDAVLVVWAPEVDAATAARELLIRAQDAVKGIPAETRQAYRDGTNGFERTLPGPDRMYPDTDTPPLPIADETVIAIRKRVPEAPWSRARRYERQGLDLRAAGRLATAPWADLFDAVEPAPGAVARRIAAAMEKRLPYHHRIGVVELPNADRLRPLVHAIEVGEILPEATERILDALIERNDLGAASVLAPYRRRSDDLEELERALEELASRASGLVNRPRDVLLRWAMGQVMPRFIGRLSPAIVRERVVEALQGSVTEIGT